MSRCLRSVLARVACNLGKARWTSGSATGCRHLPKATFERSVYVFWILSSPGSSFAGSQLGATSLAFIAPVRIDFGRHLELYRVLCSFCTALRFSNQIRLMPYNRNPEKPTTCQTIQFPIATSTSNLLEACDPPNPSYS